MGTYLYILVVSQLERGGAANGRKTRRPPRRHFARENGEEGTGGALVPHSLLQSRIGDGEGRLQREGARGAVEGHPGGRSGG